MTRTNSEELALLVLRLAKAVDADLNTAPASDLVTQCGEARELALKVLADHVVQDFVAQDEPHDAGCHVYQLGPCNC